MLRVELNFCRILWRVICCQLLVEGDTLYCVDIRLKNKNSFMSTDVDLLLSFLSCKTHRIFMTLVFFLQILIQNFNYHPHNKKIDNNVENRLKEQETPRKEKQEVTRFKQLQVMEK